MSYLLLVFAALFWGGNYVVGHLLVVNADPILLSQARWTLTAILLLSLYYKQIKANFTKIRQSFLVIMMLSIFGQVIFPLTLYIGLQYTSSLNAAIYMSATPAVVLIINKIIFHDNISHNNVFGVILSSFGVLYLILQGDFANFDAFKHLNQGDLWTALSALSWAFYCAFLRKKDKNISGNAFVSVSSLIGARILLPLTISYCLVNSSINLDAYHYINFWIGLIYLVVFPSWLAYLFWNRGIADIGATRGEIYTHIIPLSGGIFSIIFLHTEFAWFHAISLFFIVCGICLCSKKQTSQ